MLVSVDEMSQKTAVKAGTLEPTWEESMQFNAIANRSIIRVEAFDAETMGQDRTMVGPCVSRIKLPPTKIVYLHVQSLRACVGFCRLV